MKRGRWRGAVLGVAVWPLAGVLAEEGTAAPASVPPAWQVTPSVSVAELWTDNLFLSPDDEEAGFYTRWQPGLQVRGTGRRLQMAADWSVERLMFVDHAALDRTTQHLHGDAHAELLDSRLFLDGFGAMYPAYVNGAGRLGDLSRTVRKDRAALFGGDANRADVTAWGFAPRWVEHLGSWAVFDANATVSDTTTDAPERRGAGQGMAWQAAFRSGERFQRWHWAARFERRETDSRRAGGDATLQRLFAESRWSVWRTLALTASLGVEDNDHLGRLRERGGLLWTAGFVYTPTPRTTLEASFGQRTFGDTRAFRLEHRLRRFVLSAAYDESLQTTSELLRARAVLPRTDAFGNPLPVDPVSNLDTVLPLDGLSLVDEVFVNRRFNAAIGYEGRRDQVSVGAYRVQQDLARSAAVETAVGTSVTWRHTLGRRTSGGLQFDFQTREAGTPVVQSDFTRLSPFLQWQLGPDTTLRANYSWMESTSDRAADRFAEHGVMLALTCAF